jgi:hypothetical protein
MIDFMQDYLNEVAERKRVEEEAKKEEQKKKEEEEKKSEELGQELPNAEETIRQAETVIR